MQLSVSASKFTDCTSQTLDTYIKGCRKQLVSGAGTGQVWPRHCHSEDDDSCVSMKKQVTDVASEAVDDSMEIGGEVEGENTCSATAAEHDDELEYPEEVLEQCCECGENVPVWLMREHTDHHLAVKLQHEEQLIVKPAMTDGRAVRAISKKMNTLDTFFNKK